MSLTLPTVCLKPTTVTPDHPTNTIPRFFFKPAVQYIRSALQSKYLIDDLAERETGHQLDGAAEREPLSTDSDSSSAAEDPDWGFNNNAENYESAELLKNY